MGQGGGAIGESDGDGGSTLRRCDGPVDRDDDLGAGRHDLRDVGREVLDLLERVVLLAHDLLAWQLEPAEPLLEPFGGRAARVVVPVQEVELRVPLRREPGEEDSRRAVRQCQGCGR